MWLNIILLVCTTLGIQDTGVLTNIFMRLEAPELHKFQQEPENQFLNISTKYLMCMLLLYMIRFYHLHPLEGAVQL